MEAQTQTSAERPVGQLARTKTWVMAQVSRQGRAASRTARAGQTLERVPQGVESWEVTAQAPAQNGVSFKGSET